MLLHSRSVTCRRRVPPPTMRQSLQLFVSSSPTIPSLKWKNETGWYFVWTSVCELISLVGNVYVSKHYIIVFTIVSFYCDNCTPFYYICLSMPVEQFKYLLIQYKIISNNLEVDEGPVLRTKKIPNCTTKFEAAEENKTVYERMSLIQIFKKNFGGHKSFCTLQEHQEILPFARDQKILTYLLQWRSMRKYLEA